MDGPGRADRQLLADDRADERRVVVALGPPASPVRLADAVEQSGEDGVGRPQVGGGVAQGWPATAPGTPVLVEYFGWIFVSGRMWCTACETAIAASA